MIMFLASLSAFQMIAFPSVVISLVWQEEATAVMEQIVET